MFEDENYLPQPYDMCDGCNREFPPSKLKEVSDGAISLCVCCNEKYEIDLYDECHGDIKIGEMEVDLDMDNLC